VDQEVRLELQPPGTLRKHFWICCGAVVALTGACGEIWWDVNPPVAAFVVPLLTLAAWLLVLWFSGPSGASCFWTWSAAGALGSFLVSLFLSRFMHPAVAGVWFLVLLVESIPIGWERGLLQTRGFWSWWGCFLLLPALAGPLLLPSTSLLAGLLLLLGYLVLLGQWPRWRLARWRKAGSTFAERFRYFWQHFDQHCWTCALVLLLGFLLFKLFWSSIGPADGWLLGVVGVLGLLVLDEQLFRQRWQQRFWICWGAFALLLIVFGKLRHNMVPPVDGWAFGLFTLLGFLSCSFLLLFTLLQFSLAWRTLRKLLRELALLPMQQAFARLSARAVSRFNHYLFSHRARDSHLTLLAQQYQELKRLFPDFLKALQDAPPLRFMRASDAKVLREAGTAVNEVFPEQRVTPEFPEETVNNWWSELAATSSPELAKRCLRIVRCFWPAYSMQEAFGQPSKKDQTEGTEDSPDRSNQNGASHNGKANKRQPGAAAVASPITEKPIREWVEAAEDFIALEIVRYLSQFIIQLRTLLCSLSIGSWLLLLAAVVYPFFPQSQLLMVLSLLTWTVLVAIVCFLVQINSDELVSRISKTTPNRFTPDLAFIQGAGAFVLPIVAGLMVQFPFVASSVRSLLEPLFHIIH
jgi:hypothetical protein